MFGTQLKNKNQKLISKLIFVWDCLLNMLKHICEICCPYNIDLTHLSMTTQYCLHIFYLIFLIDSLL